MKLQALLHPVPPEALPDHILFSVLLQMLDKILQGNAFGYTLLTVVVLLSQALYINFISVRYKLFAKNTYFPAFGYLLVTSLNPAFNYFSEPLLINWLVLIAFNFMLRFSQAPKPRKQIFNAGFVICLPVLFQFPAVVFVLLFFCALLFLRSFHIGEWVVGIMGYLTPVYFFAGVLFLVDELPVLLKGVGIGFSLPRNLNDAVYFTGAILGLAILLIAGSFSLQQQIGKMTIYIRRSWGLIYTYLIISVLATIIAVSAVNAEWLIAAPALSLIIANSFNNDKTKRFSNFTFYFSLLLLIFCQLTINK